MIIIEGADLVGKTTLAQHLAKRLDYQLHHLSRLPDSFDRYWDYLDLAADKCVMDRFHMSEPVYATMRADNSMVLSPYRYRLIDAALAVRFPVFTVVITASDELLDARMREDEMYNLEQIKTVNALYRAIVKQDNERTDLAKWRMAYDIAIHCTASRPFPETFDANVIISRYTAMRGTFYAVHEGRPIRG